MKLLVSAAAVLLAALAVGCGNSDGTTPVCEQPDAADCFQPPSGGTGSPQADAAPTD